MTQFHPGDEVTARPSGDDTLLASGLVKGEVSTVRPPCGYDVMVLTTDNQLLPFRFGELRRARKVKVK